MTCDMVSIWALAAASSTVVQWEAARTLRASAWTASPVPRDEAAAAAGAGVLKTWEIAPVRGGYPSPVTVRIEAPELCPVFAGRLIRGVKNGPSPEWLQRRLAAIGLRSINRLVDVTNLIAYDRARPLHVYDVAKLSGTEIVVRAGQVSAATGEHEHLIALDGKTYAASAADCVIADAGGERPIGLGGVMGGESTGCDETTTDVFLESAWWQPIGIAATGRALGEALVFVHEGTLREDCVVDGVVSDSWVFGLLARDRT